MATNNLLENPAPAYRKFVDNQVLTDDQLNAVVDHLNYQDQLSRVLLSGVGIVCGLEVSLAGNGNSISLTGGAAVTTDGNLLKMVDTVYKGFKLFKDENAKYSRFADEGTTIPLWELETDTSPSDVNPLSAFEGQTGFTLDEAVAILYLEDYLKEEEDCSPVDCDTQGREVVNRLRMLLVSPDHGKEIALEDSIYSGLLSEGTDPLVNSLPHMFAKRVILTSANTESYEEFKKAYATSFKELSDRITQLGSLSVLKKTAAEVKVDPAKDLGGFSVSFRNIQYLYDFYKDLVRAYNELRLLLVKNYGLCCPDPEAFPKHVLLGTLTGIERSWRHRFYPSPILNGYSGLSDMQRLFRRLLLMIKNFITADKEKIIVTPSHEDEVLLGKQAIPFYYNLQDNGAAEPFFASWSEENVELVPNYYGYNYPDNNFDPLEVCLSGHDFYRIEGHLGQHVMDAQKEIQQIREDKGLAFDIIPIAIGKGPDEETIDYDKYRVYFEDLQVVLQAWNEEQQCLMKSASSFLSKFSVKEPGLHTNFIADRVVFEAEPGVAFTSHSVTKGKQAESQFFKEKSSKITPKKNFVLEGMSKEKDTLGSNILKSIDASDNRNDILVKTKNTVRDFVKEWDNAIVEAAVNIPLDLLGHLKETEDSKLTDIEEFTEENLEKYIAKLEAQCKKTNDSKKSFQRLNRLENSKLKAQPWREHYEYTLNRIISSCCLIEKVKVLYEKILERKREVLQLQVLHNFIEKHPGAEHRAGVSKGGTFVLLYFSTEQEPGKSTSTVESLNTIGRKNTGLLDTSFFSRSTSFKRFPDFENIPHGTVIGDLCLPYICCSTTPSTTFVFPEQLATLRLPVDHVCMKEENEAEQILMSVAPANGTVTAFINQRQLEGTIVETNNGTFFDPNKVSSDDFGKTIRFEVNGQAVDPVLTLHVKPQPGFTHSEDVVFRNNNTVAVVTFENTSQPLEGVGFEWDFGDGITKDESALKFTYAYDVKPGQNFDFEVTLVAANGPCQDSVRESVTIDVPDLEQPEEKCEEVTLATLNAALRSFKRDAESLLRAPDELKAILGNIIEMYEAIVENPVDALEGRMDQQVFSAIQKLQFQVTELLPNVESQSHQALLLKVYYELILLYFYIQACREKEIVVDSQISDVAGSWPDFTRDAIKQFTKAFTALLKVHRTHTRLEAVFNDMKERMSEELRKIMEQILQALKEFIG